MPGFVSRLLNARRTPSPSTTLRHAIGVLAEARKELSEALREKWEASYLDPADFPDMCHLVDTVASELNAGPVRAALTVDAGHILTVERRQYQDDITYAVCFSGDLIRLYRSGAFTEQEMKGGVEHEIWHKQLGHLEGNAPDSIAREDAADAHVRDREAYASFLEKLNRHFSLAGHQNGTHRQIHERIHHTRNGSFPTR